jgi:hypothetical protein
MAAVEENILAPHRQGCQTPGEAAGSDFQMASHISLNVSGKAGQFNNDTNRALVFN